MADNVNNIQDPNYNGVNDLVAGRGAWGWLNPVAKAGQWINPDKRQQYLDKTNPIIDYINEYSPFATDEQKRNLNLVNYSNINNSQNNNVAKQVQQTQNPIDVKDIINQGVSKYTPSNINVNPINNLNYNNLPNQNFAPAIRNNLPANNLVNPNTQLSQVGNNSFGGNNFNTDNGNLFGNFNFKQDQYNQNLRDTSKQNINQLDQDWRNRTNQMMGSNIGDFLTMAMQGNQDRNMMRVNQQDFSNANKYASDNLSQQNQLGLSDLQNQRQGYFQQQQANNQTFSNDLSKNDSAEKQRQNDIENQYKQGMLNAQINQENAGNNLNYAIFNNNQRMNAPQLIQNDLISQAMGNYVNHMNPSSSEMQNQMKMQYDNLNKTVEGKKLLQSLYNQGKLPSFLLANSQGYFYNNAQKDVNDKNAISRFAGQSLDPNMIPVTVKSTSIDGTNTIERSATGPNSIINTMFQQPKKQ